ncbi:hypothetical protein [Pseudomonas sp.]|uniref:hypothetical protein n=1 Tax=Pseudomonas sp. TaxID=306 RepID=UPI004053AF35
MYQLLPSFVLGFHGCDRDIGEQILSGQGQLLPSTNSYDWLGRGIYFWENSPDRALSYAAFLRDHGGRAVRKIEEPFVVGAVINLGFCLNLTDENALTLVRQAHQELVTLSEEAQTPLPMNEPGYAGDPDLLKRHLDCAVFELLHALRDEGRIQAYESVRAPFWEGGDLYPGTNFREKTHVQICVRDHACIKGYFRPLKEDGTPIQP